MTLRLRIGTFNVRGLRDNYKRRETYIWLKNKHVDVAFLQEMHVTKNVENYWRNEYGGKAWFAEGSSKAKGVGILIKRGIEGKCLEVERDKEGRFLIVKWECEKGFTS